MKEITQPVKQGWSQSFLAVVMPPPVDTDFLDIVQGLCSAAFWEVQANLAVQGSLALSP